MLHLRRMRRIAVVRHLWLVLPGLVALGCGEEKAEAPPAPPAVGIMELPISHRAGGSPSAGAVEVEVGPKELRVAGRKVMDLQNGRLPEGTAAPQTLSSLASALRDASGKPIVLRLYVLVPQGTFVRVVRTLQEAAVGPIHLLVRKGPSTEVGHMVLPPLRFVSASERPVAFQGEAARSWDDFVKQWDAIYEACRDAAERVDCDGRPERVASGGQAELALFVRDEALKLEVHRFGAPEPEEQPPAEPVVGPDGEAYVPPPPATDAAFTWRFAAATKAESPISVATRPLCGSRTCGLLLAVEDRTPVMRWISFLGAVVPDGAPEPELAVIWPER